MVAIINKQTKDQVEDSRCLFRLPYCWHWLPTRQPPP